jgi:5-methylcytosine-specific restriction endonuclease McrA
MPMDRSRYPKNWDEIALSVKVGAKWQCQECGLDCDPINHSTMSDRSQRARHTLTVHHQDYNPANNDRSNLIALCSACHLKKHVRKKGNISHGQLTLFSNDLRQN